jgi:hypothetical protein
MFSVVQLEKNDPIWGQCYDRNFLRFLAIFGKKLAFFKNQCDEQIFVS